MFQCMESLGSRLKYLDNDGTFVLFEKVLMNYLPLASKDKIKVTDQHADYFMELENLYSISKSIPCDQWNLETQMADSFAWYKSIGLIFIFNNEYYIDSNKLKQKQEEYEEYNYKKNSSSSYVKKPNK